ncbi:hypothetical protein [Paenibacillus xylanexedens]|uniref:hypothetical protein n=1 Tax=Paenibacillus xylanexedens TaxID=528191 RepID=UPI0011A6023F|nr:hypothetical protein [Paenibacillus xylanexedens]
MKKDKSLSISTWVIILFILFTISTPIIINWLLFFPYPSTPSDLGNKEWLSFWASFIGGSIGGIATLFAVYYTLKQNIEQNKVNQTIQRKQSRMEIIPYIDVRLFLNKPTANPAYALFSDLIEESKEEKSVLEDEPILQFPSGYILFKDTKTSYSNKLEQRYKSILAQGGIEQKQEGGVISWYDSGIRFVTISLKNIGIFSAVNVTLELNNNLLQDYAIMPSFNHRVDEIIVLKLVFDKDFPDGEHIFNVKFNDLQGNAYKQSFKLKLGDEANYLERISSPELIKAFEV